MRILTWLLLPLGWWLLWRGHPLTGLACLAGFAWLRIRDHEGRHGPALGRWIGRAQRLADAPAAGTTATVQAAVPPKPADVAELEAFFAVTSNYEGRHVDQLVSVIGPWSAYDDWDWGRVVYEWIRPGLRIRVATQAGHVRVVARLDPNDRSRFGTVVQTLLEKPFAFEIAADMKARTPDAE
ncbi:MAG: hypothetical protein QM581_05405 [Pseudomonas sp.]